MDIYNNSLAPSIVKNWFLEIKTVDGLTIPAPFWPGASEGKILILGTTNILSRPDFLSEKTRFVPISPGSMEDGYVVFIVSGGGSVSYLTAGGTKYELKFQDVNNKDYTVEIPLPLPARK